MYHQTVEFIEEPQDQSIFIGGIATFHCKAFAHVVYWNINGRELEWPYDWNNPPSGVHLERKFSQDTYNLSMMITGTVHRNNTRIKCRAVDGNSITSNTAILYVYCKSLLRSDCISFTNKLISF